jgi:hypothetical protein
MNRLKKIFSILLMVALLVNTFLGSTSKNVFADGTLKTELKIININVIIPLMKIQNFG